MKKLTALTTGLTYLFISAVVQAQDKVELGVRAPAQGIDPGTGVGVILSNVLTIIFVVAALLVLFFMILGAFNWITSGGDKDKIGGARKMILSALTGLAVLALAFLIVNVVGQILNINVLDLKYIPTLDSQCPNGQVINPANGTCADPATIRQSN